MEDKEQESCKVLVKDMHPLSYKDVTKDWEKNSKECYHELVGIVDLPIVLAQCPSVPVFQCSSVPGNLYKPSFIKK